MNTKVVCATDYRDNAPHVYLTSQKKTTSASHSAAAAESYAKLKQRRAWDMAISPGKSLPMNAFMLYMSGGGVQIFSIGILAMLLLNPIKAVSTINTGTL